jgi:RNA polymerase sigma-70 factor (ECF subfamily)
VGPDEEVIATGRDEHELADALRVGDPSALAELFDRHGDRIYNHCFRVTGDWSDAEDATASVFLEVWRHRDRVHTDEGSALPWLFGVATNVCRNLTRKRRRGLRALTLIPEPAPVPDHAEEVTDRVATEQRMRHVLDAVSALPQRERDVLALVVWSGLSYEDAARSLGVPVGTVRSRLSRARSRLARLGAGDGEDR